MRKHIVPANAATATLMLSLVLLVAACDRGKTEGDTVSTDSVAVGNVGGQVGVGSDAALADAAGRERHEGLMARRMAARSTAAYAPVATAEAGAAAPPPPVAPAVDGRSISLGSPLPPLDAGGAMLIRNGQANVQVTRVDDAVGRLRQTATRLGGFVANTSIVGGKEEHRSAQLEIRVPSAQFDAAVAALGELGKVQSVSATVQDVGDEYVDMSARVANARHMEARLVEMLARRTGKLSEALTVEQELRRVREEIERYDARLKWLERKTALSSLQVALYEPQSVLDQRGPNPIAEAFAEAWRRAVGVVAWAIASLGLLIPLALALWVGYQLVRRIPRWRGGAATP